MTKALENGDLYFAYRPKVGRASVRALEDIQRFYMILHPKDQNTYRLLTIGRKKLPDVRNGNQYQYWGFIEKLSRASEELKDELSAKIYETKTRGSRHLSPTRLAGEGIYSIVSHENHTHFTYMLELPHKTGEVQHELNIEKEASYILSVKNPETPHPQGLGLKAQKKLKLPKYLQNHFQNRKFIPVDPTEYLNYEGVEILLISSSEDVSRDLGFQLKPENETKETAEIYRDLKIQQNRLPVRPLFEGQWT